MPTVPIRPIITGDAQIDTFARDVVAYLRRLEAGVGPTGPAGAAGANGSNGTNGTNGTNGAAGPPGEFAPVADIGSSVARWQYTETTASLPNLVSGGASCTMAGGGGSDGNGAGVFDSTSRSCRIYDGSSGLYTTTGALTAPTSALTLCLFIKPLLNGASATAPRVLFGISMVANPGDPATTPTDWIVAAYATGGQSVQEGQMPWKASVRRSGVGTFDTSDFTSGGGKERAMIKLGVWSHIAITFDGSNARTYVNGISEGTAASSGTLDTSANERIGVGRLGTGQNGQACQFADMRLYNAALSASDIMTLAMSGKATV